MDWWFGVRFILVNMRHCCILNYIVTHEKKLRDYYFCIYIYIYIHHLGEEFLIKWGIGPQI